MATAAYPLSIEQFIGSDEYPDLTSHMRAALAIRPNGAVCEFGVYQGRSLRIIASLCEQKVYGFDSWEGLPCDWEKAPHIKSKRGQYKSQPPTNIPDNVELVKGWFRDTIGALTEHTVGFVHVDCDLYESAKDVLFGLNDRLAAGAVIVFDELYRFNAPQEYVNWEQHEWRALNEWISECGREVEVFGHVKDYSAASVIVK